LGRPYLDEELDVEVSVVWARTIPETKSANKESSADFDLIVKWIWFGIVLVLVASIINVLIKKK
jgi:hypothetical protein